MKDFPFRRERSFMNLLVSARKLWMYIVCNIVLVGMQASNWIFVGPYFWLPMELDFEGELPDEKWT